MGQVIASDGKPQAIPSTEAKPTDRQFVFVVGAPRSGTTWLVQMLSLHTAVASIPNELTVFSRYMAHWLQQYDMEADNHEQGRWSMGMPMLFERQEFHALMVQMLDTCYARVLQHNPTATHIFDKHPYYSQHIPVIDRLLPQSKFVHIIRDGREVAVSMMSAKDRIGFGAGEIKGAATNWYQCVTQAREQGRLLGPGRYLELRYDELRKDPVTQLTRAFDFCELEIDPVVLKAIADEYHISRKQVSGGNTAVNAIRDKSGEIWKQQLSLEQRYLFDRYAGHLLRELGYAEAHWWALRSSDTLKMKLRPVHHKLRSSLRSLLHIWLTPSVPPLK